MFQARAIFSSAVKNSLASLYKTAVNLEHARARRSTDLQAI
jgi:hypothetical protein